MRPIARARGDRFNRRIARSKRPYIGCLIWRVAPIFLSGGCSAGQGGGRRPLGSSGAEAHRYIVDIDSYSKYLYRFSKNYKRFSLYGLFQGHI